MILINLRRVSTLVAVAITLVVTSNPASAKVVEFMPAVAVGDIDEFEISPDGTLIAFIGSLDNGFGNDDQTYVAPIGGGAATMLNPSTTGDNDGGIAWLPNQSAVIVRYEEDINDPALGNELYLLPIDGSQVSTMLTVGSGNAFDPQVAPDGNTLYFSDGGRVFVTSISGAVATPTLLNPGDISEIDTGSYAQVGTDIVFAGFDPAVPGAGNGTPENAFYRTAGDGSTANSPTLIPVTNSSATSDIDFMEVTPDGQTIIFRGDYTTNGKDELYSVAITGGVATPLLPANVDNDLDVGSFTISPDGTTIAFQGDLTTNGIGELYAMSIDGGTPIVVNDPLLTAGSDVASGVDKIGFSLDSRDIYYLADGRTDGTFELFRVNNPVPEPSSLLLIASAACLAMLRRRR